MAASRATNTQSQNDGEKAHSSSVDHSGPAAVGEDDTEACLPPPKALRTPHSVGDQLLDVEERLCQELSRIHFGPPVTHIYNPLSYAVETHQCFVRCYGDSKKRVMFLGMNPGPFGMAQTGVGKSV